MGLPIDQFIEKFTRLNANRTGLSLIEKENGECIFLEGLNTCLIQPVKPVQCRGFPNEWRFPGWREVCEAIELSPPDTVQKVIDAPRDASKAPDPEPAADEALEFSEL